ncbi:unnamed protein product [Caenorhabditis angaria]|uniref:CRAL-TRIO domain-containing protein n=1 Tax=Caenorhabditis angaria TaxID=860376 RepID=A0A9P1IK10_9PELO|nr:unnamed protein product [Caenorhabditis angaria]
MTAAAKLEDRSGQPITEAERKTIEEVRKRITDSLPEGIPSDIDTDINLCRWIRGYKGDQIKLVDNFKHYIASRKAAGFVGEDFAEKFFEMDEIEPFLKWIASSRLQDRQWSEELNAYLFVERAWSQPREFIKTFKTSDYLLHCFGYSEMLQQLILRREKNQSPEKGPVQTIVIFDLSTVNITDYVNPMSGYMKLWQIRSELWQNWYPEMVQRIYLVNPPRLINLLWKVARVFLSEENLKRIEIVGNMPDLANKHLPRWFVPKEYGGDFVNTTPPGDETGVSIRQKITNKDHYIPHLHYKANGLLDRPKSSHKDISPNTPFVVNIQVGEGKSLLWDFTVSGEVEFCISRNKNPNDLVYPRLHLVTNKLNEEGVLKKLREGEYSLEFFNTSGYFTLKLEYTIAVV